MPSYFSEPVLIIPKWTSNISQIGVSAFVNDLNYSTTGQVTTLSNVILSQVALVQASVTTLNQNLVSNISFVSTGLNTLNQNLVSNVASIQSNVSTLYSQINILNQNVVSNVASIKSNVVVLYAQVATLNQMIVSNVSSLSANVNILYAQVGTLNQMIIANVSSLSANVSILYSQVATLNQIVVSNLSTLYSQVAVVSNSVSSINIAIGNINQVVANISNTATLQYANIYGTFANVITFAKLSNVSVTALKDGANILTYGNLASIDIRKLGNVANIVYAGANNSIFINNANYISQGAQTILVGDSLQSGNLVYAKKRLQVGNIILEEGMVNGTNGFKILSDLWSGAELAMSAGGLAMGAFGAFKQLFNNDGSIAQDLQNEIDDGISSGNTAITIDWSQLRNSPLGYTGSIVKDIGIQRHMYAGGSIFYDSTDTSQNFYGSVQMGTPSSYTKVIDLQNQIGYFKTLQTGDLTATGNVIATKAITGGTLSAANIVATQFITATKDITATGNISASHVTASQTLTANAINTTGFIGNNVKFYTDADAMGNLKVYKNLTNFGSLSANSLSVSYDSNFGGNIYTNNLFFSGNTYFNNQVVQFSQFTGNTKSISYPGNVAISGNVTASNYFVGTSNLQSYIVSTVGNAWTQSGGNVSTKANVFITGDLNISNNILVPQGYIMCDMIKTNEHELLIDGNVKLINDSYLIVDPSYLEVQGNLTLWNFLQCNGGFHANGQALLSGNVDIVGQTSIVGNLVLQSDILIQGNIQSVDASMWIGANNLSLIGNIYTSANLHVNNVLINSLFASANNTYLANNTGYAQIAIIQASTLKLPNAVNFTGKYSQLEGAVTNNIANNASYNAVLGDTTTTNILNTGGLTMGGTAGGKMYMGYNITNNRQVWFQDTTAPTNNSTAALRIVLGTGNVAYISGVSTDNTLVMPLTIDGKVNIPVSLSLVNASTFTGSYTELANKPTIPTLTSQLTNNSGFLTSVGTGYIANNVSYIVSCGAITAPSITLPNAVFTGSYTELSAKPTIPTQTSQLTNNSGFLTSVGTGYVANNTSYNISCGSLTASGNINTNVKVGDCGYGVGYATFSHSSQFSPGGYAVLQSSAGLTYFGCATGQNMYFGCNNSYFGYWSTAGLTLGSGSVPSYTLDVVGTARASSSLLIGANPVFQPTVRNTYTLSTPTDTFGSTAAGASYYCRNIQITAGTAGGGAMWNFTSAPNIYGSDLLLTAGSLNDGANNGAGPVNYYPGNVYIQSGIGYNGVGGQASGTIIFQTGALSGLNYSERMRVHSNGMVGIGTNAPVYNLDISGRTRVASDQTRGVNWDGAVGQLLVSGSSNANKRLVLAYDTTNNYGVIQSVVAGTGWTALCLNPDSGNVGIGTTSPSYTLDVNGNGRFTNTLDLGGASAMRVGSGAYLSASNSTGTQEVWCYPRYTDNITYINYGSAGFNIRNNASTSTMFMNNANQIGINNTSPAYTVDITGTFRTTGASNLCTGNFQVATTGVDCFPALYAHTFATVNTTTRVGTSALTVLGNTSTTGIQTGQYSFASEVNPLTVGTMAIGTNASILGPHSQYYTQTDNYPLRQDLHYSHDNLAIGFDNYFDGSAFKASHTSASYQIFKYLGVLNFTYGAATTAGTTVSPVNTMTIYQNKVILNGQSATYQFSINGYSLQNALMAVYSNGVSAPTFQVYGSNLGINITGAPSYNLDCNGNARFSGTVYVNGTDAVSLGTIAYMTTASTLGTGAFGATTAPYALVGGRGRFSQVDVFSDKRLKTNIQTRDSKSDLELLMKVPMKQFDYIDNVQHATDAHIGCIAQEIEAVPGLENVVQHHPDFVPNHYKPVDIVEVDDGLFSLVGDFDEKSETKIKFFYLKGEKEVCAEGTVINNHIQHSEGSLNVSHIFLYGVEKQDVKSVCYNALYSLNISATQHLYKIILELKEEINQLKNKSLSTL